MTTRVYDDVRVSATVVHTVAPGIPLFFGRGGHSGTKESQKKNNNILVCTSLEPGWERATNQKISILKKRLQNIMAFDLTVARLLATISQFFKP